MLHVHIRNKFKYGMFIYVPSDFTLACFNGFQVVPHITDSIKNWIEMVSVIPVDGEEGPADVCVIELGGTVGMRALKRRGIKSSSPSLPCFHRYLVSYLISREEII